jgi:hypothetical protein
VKGAGHSIGRENKEIMKRMLLKPEWKRKKSKPRMR